jgi:hypothetical protein
MPTAALAPLTATDRLLAKITYLVVHARQQMKPAVSLSRVMIEAVPDSFLCFQVSPLAGQPLQPANVYQLRQRVATLRAAVMGTVTAPSTLITDWLSARTSSKDAIAYQLHKHVATRRAATMGTVWVNSTLLMARRFAPTSLQDALASKLRRPAAILRVARSATVRVNSI